MRHADVVAPLQTKFNDVIYIKGDAWVRCARYTDGGGERNVVVGLSNGEVKVTTMPPYTTEEGPMRQMDVEEEALPALTQMKCWRCTLPYFYRTRLK